MCLNRYTHSLKKTSTDDDDIYYHNSLHNGIFYGGYNVMDDASDIKKTTYNYIHATSDIKFVSGLTLGQRTKPPGYSHLFWYYMNNEFTNVRLPKWTSHSISSWFDNLHNMHICGRSMLDISDVTELSVRVGGMNEMHTWIDLHENEIKYISIVKMTKIPIMMDQNRYSKILVSYKKTDGIVMKEIDITNRPWNHNDPLRHSSYEKLLDWNKVKFCVDFFNGDLCDKNLSENTSFDANFLDRLDLSITI